MSITITINDALRCYIDPLTASEYAALECSLLAEGCRDALVLWGHTLVDGHNRYAICQRHGIAFRTVQNDSFASLDDVMLWMIDNHLARRSVSDFQRGVLALRKKDIVSQRGGAGQQGVRDGAGDPAPAAPPAARAPLSTREDIAKAARLSSNTIGQIEKIQKAAAPALVEAVRAGTISINAAASVASLPEAEQVAAVAGGKKQLQQAARAIRAQKAALRPPKTPAPWDEADGAAGPDAATPAAPDAVTRLRAEIARLEARNAALQAENADLNARIAALIDPS